MANIASNNVPPVPNEHSILSVPDSEVQEISKGVQQVTVSRINNVWTKWFMDLRTKVNTINAASISLANITTTGTVVSNGGGNFATEALPAGTYGDTTHVPQVTVGANGYITNITDVALPVSGTVTSVGLAAPTQFTVSGSPVTTSGTLTFAWNTQTANTVLAGPASGVAAAPTFRDLALADLTFALPIDFIRGLKMIWVSATSVSVSTGEAVIPATSKLEIVSSTLTLSGLSLSASTNYHVYLFDVAGTPTIECVATAPAAPYQGTARAKTGDTTRRYVGSVLTDGSGNLVLFSHETDAGLVLYPAAGGTLRVLAAGAATTSTVVACSAFIPVTAMYANARYLNTSTVATTFWVGRGDQTVTSAAYFLAVGNNNNAAFGLAPLDTSQRLAYLNSGTPSAGNGGYIDLNGYQYER